MKKKNLTMSNESSDGSIIWNITEEPGTFTTDESVLKGKIFIKIVMHKDGSIKVLGVEPEKYEKKAMMSELKQYSIDMMRDMLGILHGKKSSDGNTYYKLVM